MKITREMIGAAHDVCLKKGDFVLSADLLERLYSAMYERSQEKADAARLNWIDKALFQHQWNGVVGAGAKTYWRIAGDYRQTAAKMEGETFREAVDAAIRDLKEPK